MSINPKSMGLLLFTRGGGFDPLTSLLYFSSSFLKKIIKDT